MLITFKSNPFSRRIVHVTISREATDFDRSVIEFILPTDPGIVKPKPGSDFKTTVVRYFTFVSVGLRTLNICSSLFHLR